jgi:succinyl-CoA synthetase beta subunit
MKLHEYRGNELLRQYGMANAAEKVVTAARRKA